jgi:hypothetical protein
MERVLKVGILRRGIPKAIYVDNGKVYASNQFGAACASLGIERIHAAPYSPEGYPEDFIIPKKRIESLNCEGFYSFSHRIFGIIFSTGLSTFQATQF